MFVEKSAQAGQPRQGLNVRSNVAADFTHRGEHSRRRLITNIQPRKWLMPSVRRAMFIVTRAAGVLTPSGVKCSSPLLGTWNS